MPYNVSLIQYNGTSGGLKSIGAFGFPTSGFNYMIASFWVCLPVVGGLGCDLGMTGNFFDILASTRSTQNNRITLTLTNSAAVQIYNATFNSALTSNARANILLSVDAGNQVVQLYVNDQPKTPTSGGWLLAGLLAGVLAGSQQVLSFIGTDSGSIEPAAADMFVACPNVFFDLSVTANRRKFLNADLSPVYLGANGASPGLGTPPVYLTAPAAANDFLHNYGGGPSFGFDINGTVQSVSFQAPGTCTVPATTLPASLADLWFAPTTDFIDLSVRLSRRLFISPEAAPISLGAAGSRPTGNTPPAFFSRTTGALPDTFATNLGNGGGFTLSGGDLTNAATSPPCSLEVSTTTTPASKGAGVVGDYRNGGLYAWNMDTLTDAGSQRRWVRSWRALKDPVDTAVRFNSLFVDMETGAQVPVSAKPVMVLRYSDDGGHTWSNPRIMAVGPLGQTAWTVKANRLGSTRRNARSDRIFELSSSDQFKVAIMGADLEVG